MWASISPSNLVYLIWLERKLRGHTIVNYTFHRNSLSKSRSVKWVFCARTKFCLNWRSRARSNSLWRFNWIHQQQMKNTVGVFQRWDCCYILVLIVSTFFCLLTFSRNTLIVTAWRNGSETINHFSWWRVGGWSGEVGGYLLVAMITPTWIGTKITR